MKKTEKKSIFKSIQFDQKKSVTKVLLAMPAQTNHAAISWTVFVRLNSHPADICDILWHIFNIYQYIYISIDIPKKKSNRYLSMIQYRTSQRPKWPSQALRLQSSPHCSRFCCSLWHCNVHRSDQLLWLPWVVHGPGPRVGKLGSFQSPFCTARCQNCQRISNYLSLSFFRTVMYGVPRSRVAVANLQSRWWTTASPEFESWRKSHVNGEDVAKAAPK